MESLKYLNDLEKLPGKTEKINLKDLVGKLGDLKRDNLAIELGIAGEIGLLYAFNELNVNDTLFEAYQSQYPNLSETKSLFDKVIEAHGSGESSFGGLVSGVKGKLYEINLQETLNTNYPDWNFSIAENANQPIWDLIGIGPEGQEILVQAKMGAASYAFDVKERMLDNPDVLFATSREIHEKILESSPELAAQFIDVDVSNVELTDEVSSGLEQLLANHGVDVPDGIGDLLPFVGEIVAGIKLLVELSKVNQDFDKVDISDKRRIQGLRAIMAFSKFGISSVISIAGTALGSAVFPGVGSLIGGLGGAGMGMYINKKVKPHLNEIALELMGLDEDEMFYLRRKEAIDNIGMNMNKYSSMLLAS